MALYVRENILSPGMEIKKILTQIKSPIYYLPPPPSSPSKVKCPAPYKGIHCSAPGHLSINLISINLNSMNELVHEFKKTHINSAIFARSTLYVTLILNHWSSRV